MTTQGHPKALEKIESMTVSVFLLHECVPRPYEAKMTKLPKAPNYFSQKARKLWASINGEYDLEDEAAELLRVALENLDLADKARELLRTEGLAIDGRKHPASDSVKLHDEMFMRAIRQLQLDVVAPGPIGRPPGRKT